MILFVCTGNTCRSPLAQALAQKLGMDAVSAGLYAQPGAPATPEAQQAAQAHGCDLRCHRAQPLTAALVSAADLICPMTAAHADAICSRYPQAAGKLQPLFPEIPDPFGQGLEAYMACASALLQALDRLSLAAPCLRSQLGGTLPFQVLPETDSTNLRVKEAARAGSIAAPYLLIAGHQTAGRGRLGRQFHSPEGTGLYMTLLLRPAAFADATRLTLLAAVAVCQAMEELTDLRPRIKWVNDIFVDGKKVCGILAEAVDDQVAVGIGVNMRTPPEGFPPEAAIAGALNREITRGQLAAAIARRMLAGTANLSDPRILEEYRRRMPLIGREISYQQGEQTHCASVLGVAEDGGLIVSENGAETVLRTGEISLGSQALESVMAAAAPPQA